MGLPSRHLHVSGLSRPVTTSKWVSRQTPLRKTTRGHAYRTVLPSTACRSRLARQGDHTLSAVDAVSSVIGAIILTAVLSPDLTRYARNGRNAILSVLGVVVGFPAALLLAAVPAAVYGGHDLLGVMKSSAHRSLESIWWISSCRAGVAANLKNCLRRRPSAAARSSHG